MSRSGMIAAADHGVQLPKFGSPGEAEATLYGERDRLLAQLAEFARDSNGFDLTFEPESLKALEGWYFRLLDGDAFRGPSMTRVEFERCIAIYFGEVFVRSTPAFEWFVEEYVFLPGRYEIGVSRPGVAIGLSRPKAPTPRERNKREQSLWREFLLYAGSR
jgi:hypothetical protein